MQKASFKWLTVGLLTVFCFASVANAQGQRQRGQRGQRGGGFGQRGGASVAQTKIALLRVEQATQAADIDADTVKVINEALEAARNQDRGERPRVNFQELSEAEREKMFAEFRERQKKQTEAAAKVLADNLLPPQDDRLTEIALQVLGLRALDDEAVAAKLKVSASQKEKLAKAREESSAQMREKMGELFRGGGGGGNIDRDAMRKQFEEMRKKSDEALLAVLTKDQQNQFTKMQGEKVELPQGAAFGGGRGGFGNRRGGARPGGGRPGGNRPARPGGNRPARPGSDNNNDNN